MQQFFCADKFSKVSRSYGIGSDLRSTLGTQHEIAVVCWLVSVDNCREVTVEWRAARGDENIRPREEVGVYVCCLFGRWLVASTYRIRPKNRFRTLLVAIEAQDRHMHGRLAAGFGVPLKRTMGKATAPALGQDRSPKRRRRIALAN